MDLTVRLLQCCLLARSKQLFCQQECPLASGYVPQPDIFPLSVFPFSAVLNEGCTGFILCAPL